MSGKIRKRGPTIKVHQPRIKQNPQRVVFKMWLKKYFTKIFETLFKIRVGHENHQGIENNLSYDQKNGLKVLL